MFSVLIRIASILMSAYNVYYHDKIRTFPKKYLYITKYLFSWAIGRIFLGTKQKKRVRISHGKRTISFRVIKALKYYLNNEKIFLK